MSHYTYPGVLLFVQYCSKKGISSCPGGHAFSCLRRLFFPRCLFCRVSHMPLPRQTALRNNTTTVSLAFTGLITSGANSGTALTGGLTIGIRSDGFFNGNFHLPDGTQISVSGRVRSNGKLNITFYTSSGQPFITGQGRLNAAGEYVGPFQVYSGGKQVAWGIWSALPVASPDKVLALAFVGTTTKGPDAGVSYSGAIVLNSSTLVGTMNLPNGAIVGVT